MNENIDLTKILKDCPEGWEFWSPLFGEVEFECIEDKNFVSINKNGTTLFFFTDATFPLGNNKSIEIMLYPSKEQRDWSKFSAPWYKKEKFDPNTLQQYDRVLVRDYANHSWKVDFYSHKNVNTEYQYRCVGNAYRFCIPYNDDTKHLVGTNKEVPEYYKYWED